MLVMNEKDRYMSWEYCEVFDYCKEKVYDNSSNQKFLVEWNDINKTKLWVIFFH
jgi:hypothetical protein